MCDFCKEFNWLPYNIKVMALQDLVPGLRMMIDYFQEGVCPLCGHRIPYEYMWPNDGRTPRIFDDTCYRRFVVNNHSGKCLICGERLDNQTISLHRQMPRETCYTVHQNGCLLVLQKIAGRVLGLDRNLALPNPQLMQGQYSNPSYYPQPAEDYIDAEWEELGYPALPGAQAQIEYHPRTVLDFNAARKPEHEVVRLPRRK